MNAPDTPPPLPEPARERWQPLRTGLVDLYLYDCEEFRFRDGHLLLRGNNGTGKSKVLSLTLPFLLDGSLAPARVEPDGERSKRMEWNLLMGRHEQRTGYAWIEFGRRDAAGDARYLTLGCGLRAVAGRARVDAWYFITEQRIGEELWLMTPERAVLTRERLGTALGSHGRLYDTIEKYRSAVDERLFGLGAPRYVALLDTLIELRQPQLSKKPDEDGLSRALSNALPALPRAVLEDVAEAMSQLEAYREELAGIERLREVVARFARRYRGYARVQARRQAGVLRQAQTGVDNASRVLAEAREQHVEALAAVQLASARVAELVATLQRERAAEDALRSGPLMEDAERLRGAEGAAELCTRELRQAVARREAAARRLAEERAQLARREAAAQAAAAAVEQALGQAEEAAARAGVAAAHTRACTPLLPPAPPPAEAPRAADALRTTLREEAARRREQTAQIRRRLQAHGAALAERARAQDRCDDRAAALEQAEGATRAAQSALRAAAAALCGAWSAWLAGLRELALPDPDGTLAALAEWAETQDGPNPARRRVDEAQARCLHALAAQASTLGAERAQRQADDRALAEEAARLARGEDRLPPSPHTRDTQSRVGRPGAPFWQLVDFREEVDDAARAGLEAALEASGLLDAWLTPQGTLLHARTHDAWLTARAPQAHSLAAWLVPGENTAVAAESVSAVLAAIACAEEEVAEAEAWVSPAGEFRIGPLRGRWAKERAEYLGFAAREAARRRRLVAIAAEREQIAAALAALARAEAALAARRAALDAELTALPADDALRAAHAQASAAEHARRAAHERLVEADQLLQRAAERVREARRALDTDAADLGLPADGEALAAVESAVQEYALAAQQLCQALRDGWQAQADHDAQRAREAAASADHTQVAREVEARRGDEREAVARRDQLRAQVGAQVAELERRLGEVQRAITQAERENAAAAEALAAAREQRARTEQKASDAAALHEERQGVRRAAVATLREFARSGLLGVALPELLVPDDTRDWPVEPALGLAREVERALHDVPAADDDWQRVQAALSRDYTELGQSLSAQGQQVDGRQTDFGLVVRIVHAGSEQRPDLLERRLDEETAQRRAILTAREREVIENHLQAEVATHLQRLMQAAEQRVQGINAELDRRRTSTGVRYRLAWRARQEGDGGAPAGLAEMRERLLRRAADAWSPADRRHVGEFLQARIVAERARDDSGTLLEHLLRALDYRAWHRFRVERFQDGSWRRLSGPASSGERALGLTVPLFAAASSHYTSAGSPHAPRLVLLDEAFAGIDDEARAQCMALIREFDLDFVMTSEREWGCYAELPGVAICHLIRRDGVDAVFVSRWSWDGRTRSAEHDPGRRFPQAAGATP